MQAGHCQVKPRPVRSMVLQPAVWVLWRQGIGAPRRKLGNPTVEAARFLAPQIYFAGELQSFRFEGSLGCFSMTFRLRVLVFRVC